MSLSRPLAWLGAAALAAGVLLVVALAEGAGRDAHGEGATPPEGLSARLSSLGAPAGEDAYGWQPVAIGGGGFITGYDADPTGATRVIRTDVYGAYRWDQALDRWVQLANSASMPAEERVQDGANEGVYEIVVAPSRPARLYMAIKGLVFRSDDGGASFVATSRAAPFPVVFDANGEYRHAGPFLAVSPTDPDLLLFATPAAGVWRSGDAGASWARAEGLDAAAGAPGAGALLWFDRSRRVWAMPPGGGAGAGMRVSTDGGKNFMPLVPEGTPQPRHLTQGAFAPDGSFFGVDRQGRGVWRYRDGAWTALAAKIGDWPFAAVAVNPRGGQVLVFDAGGSAWRSWDGGDSFWPLPHRSRAGAGDPPWLRVSNRSYFAMGRVMFDPVVPDRLWVGAGTGVYYADIPSQALQVEWISQTRGIEELVANDVIQPPGRAPLFAAWDFGIHRKERLDQFSTTYGPRERVLIAAQQLDWSPADPDFIVTNASDTRPCCAEDGDAVMAGYSLDAGRSWRKFATLPAPPGVDPRDPWRMAFGSIAVSSGDTRNIVWLPTNDRAPFFTRDRGETWQRVSFPGEMLPHTGSHPHYYYHRKTLAADRVAPGVFYLVHGGGGANEALKGLWVTRDGGGSWTRVFEGEIAPRSQFSAKLRAVPGQAGHLFFTSGVAGDGDTRLRRSLDGGRSWTAMAGVDRVDDIGFGKPAPGAAYPAIYISGQVGGGYGIWRSTDAAASWTRIGGFPAGRLDQVTVVAGDPDAFGRVYLGYKGSGWIYGQPARCEPAAYRFPDGAECHAIR